MGDRRGEAQRASRHVVVDASSGISRSLNSRHLDAEYQPELVRSVPAFDAGVTLIRTFAPATLERRENAHFADAGPRSGLAAQTRRKALTRATPCQLRPGDAITVAFRHFAIYR